jgi:hypothetical protein
MISPLQIFTGCAVLSCGSTHGIMLSTFTAVAGESLGPVEELCGLEELRQQSLETWELMARAFLLSTFAFAKASPRVCIDDCRGGSKGPLHGHPTFCRLPTHTLMILFAIEPSFKCLLAIGVAGDGELNSCSAWHI